MTNEIKEGIYFNMTDEEYHSLPCLNRSTMEEVVIGDEQAAYSSYLNPDKPVNNPTPAMELGTAIHSAVLEPDDFGHLYIKKPEVEDYQDKIIFKGNDDFKAFFKNVGEKVSGTKAELIQRISPYIGEEHLIWENVLTDFNAQVSCGKRALSSDNFEVVEGIMDSINKRPKIREILSKGYSEVTIIWRDEETGILCKCRLDYVRPEAIGELKSFALKSKKPLKKVVCDEIAYNQYNFQYKVYSQALETIIRKIRKKEAEVFGEVDQEWLEAFLKSPKKQFYIVFVRTAAPFQSVAVLLEKGVEGATENVYHSEATLMYRHAIDRFKIIKEKVEKGEIIIEEEIITLDDMHIPQIQYQANFIGL